MTVILPQTKNLSTFTGLMSLASAVIKNLNKSSVASKTTSLARQMSERPTSVILQTDMVVLKYKVGGQKPTRETTFFFFFNFFKFFFKRKNLGLNLPFYPVLMIG